MKVRKLAYSLGAEVTDLDLRKPQSDAVINEIREAWLEHLVLCFPRQDLSPNELVAFTARFGKLDDDRAGSLWNLPDHPKVNIIANKPVEIGAKTIVPVIADKWHTDLSFALRPSSATWLNAKQLPPIGGDTMFASMYAAYDALSPSMQGFIGGLEGMHDVSMSPDWGRYTPEIQARRRGTHPPVVHPVVRTHPESGRKGIFAGGFLRKLIGFTEQESRPIIDLLNTHATDYQFVYRHKWSKDDLLMWDNRCTMHNAVQDYDRTQLRLLNRATLLAEKSGRYYEAENASSAPASMS